MNIDYLPTCQQVVTMRDDKEVLCGWPSIAMVWFSNDKKDAFYICEKCLEELEEEIEEEDRNLS